MCSNDQGPMTKTAIIISLHWVLLWLVKDVDSDAFGHAVASDLGLHFCSGLSV